MKIYIKNTPDLVIPKRSSEVAAGYDIVATSEPKIVGQKTAPDDITSGWHSIDYIEYETNIYIAPSVVTFHTLIHPRSSISKYNLVLANSIGLVDNDYRGMVICRFKYIWQPKDFWMPLPGNGKLIGYIANDKIYKKGDTIAQLVFEPTVDVEFELVDELNQTQRGSGGFGSTDKNVSPNKDTTPAFGYVPIINEDDVIKIRAEQPPVKTVETIDLPKYTKDTPYSKEGTSDIVKQWKEKLKKETPVGYEVLIKEREKHQ